VAPPTISSASERDVVEGMNASEKDPRSVLGKNVRDSKGDEAGGDEKRGGLMR
jgi:hypothetical protein